MSGSTAAVRASLSVASVLFHGAAGFSARPALRVQGRTLTYGELNDRALRVAAALLDFGAQHETVGIVGQRKPSSYVGVVGILYAGCSYVPINPKYSKARILSILRASGVRFLIGDGDDLDVLESALGADAPPMLATLMPEGEAPTRPHWQDERALRTSTPLDRPVAVTPDHLAYVLFTSGSTGVPKGVQVAHRNVLAFLRSMSALYPLEPGFRASQTFDFSFDPSVSDMLFTWARGGVLCVVPEDELLLPHEFIRREAISYWNSVPAIAAFMNRMGHLHPGAFPDLRHSMFCGEQFPRHVAEAWKRAAPASTVENLYGPTEATIYISHYTYVAADEGKPFTNSILPIGCPFLDHEFALVDEAGRRLPDHKVGEIVFKGPQVTRGYLHDETRTAAVFVSFEWDASRATWYRSGDLGFCNADGNLECIGRKDNQIKLGGRRIEIGEIEGVLHCYPATRDAVVVPLRDANDIVTGCVAFVTRSIEKSDEVAIRRESQQCLERLFFPRKIMTIEALPLAASGKIDRKALAKMAQEIFAADYAAGNG